MKSHLQCLHCGNKVQEVTNDGNGKKNLESKPSEQFCCLGCKAAYRIINQLGFDRYYSLRVINPKERKIKPEPAEETDISEFIHDEKNGIYSATLMIQGLHCAACIWLIENILKKQKEVVNARVNLTKKTLFLTWKAEDKNAAAVGNRLSHLICEIGYKLLPLDAEILKTEEKKYSDSIFLSLAVAGFGAGNVMLFSLSLWFSDVIDMGSGTRDLLHFFSSLIALPVVIFSSRPFFISAFRSLKAGYPNMDLAISIAIFLACIVSLFETFRSATHVYFDSAVMLIFFLLIGRYLDLRARKNAFAIASEFSLLAASYGRIEEDDKVRIVPAKQLQPGMILIAAAGEKIAADGVIIEGDSEFDSSAITGETLPQKIGVGKEVFAGMINLVAPVRIRITKPAQNSLLAKIIRLSEEVEQRKGHYVRLADYLARFYTPVVHLLALITFGWWMFMLKSHWEVALMNATAVLIITCPCALALAIPIVQTIVISSFIKKGVLIKSGEALEKLRKISVIIFDKTGSITTGQARLQQVFLLRNGDKILLQNQARDSYLKLAASLAKNSRHPIANAIAASYDDKLEALQTSEIQGLGLEANFENKTLKLGRKSFCGIVGDYDFADESLTCFMKFGEEEVAFLLLDELKPDAKLVVQDLKQLNKRVILLSGDNQKAVSKVAQELGIAEFYFEQTPVTKVHFLEKLKNQKQKFIMIGDGLNDAPSLALADVSISFSAAVNISQNIADIVIQGNKLKPIVELINSSAKSVSIMKENLIIALIYNLIAVPFAMAGQVVPLIAAIAMSSSSLLVLLNSLKITKKSCVAY